MIKEEVTNSKESHWVSWKSWMEESKGFKWYKHSTHVVNSQEFKKKYLRGKKYIKIQYSNVLLKQNNMEEREQKLGRARDSSTRL